MADKMKQLSESEKKLFQLVLDGKLEEVNQILNEPGVRVDCIDESGMTPLQQAAFKSHIEIAKLLLARGADVNSNYHDSGYTALMFAALSGDVEMTRIILEAGAKTSLQNSMGRNAAQMGAFVGQTQCVSLINNFYSKEDLEYYTVPRGLETEPKLPPALCPSLYNFILINNLCPVKLALYLEEHSALLAEHKKMYRLLDLLCEKSMKARETNEVMGVKFHYLAGVMKAAGKAYDEGNLERWIKSLLQGRDSDGFPVMQEQFIRNVLKEFTYMENQLIQQICRTIAPVQLGNEPTALNVLTNSINGQRFANEDDNPCYTCMDFHATKKCAACNMVTYCSRKCQSLHWFQHKRYCKILAVQYQKQEKKRAADKKQEEEEEARKKEEEEKQKENGGGDSMEIQKEKESGDSMEIESSENTAEDDSKQLEQKTADLTLDEPSEGKQLETPASA